jgi:hypothetical protein
MIQQVKNCLLRMLNAGNIRFCAMAVRIYSHRQNKAQRQFGLARHLGNLN